MATTVEYIAYTPKFGGTQRETTETYSVTAGPAVLEKAKRRARALASKTGHSHIAVADTTGKLLWNGPAFAP